MDIKVRFLKNVLEEINLFQILQKQPFRAAAKLLGRFFFSNFGMN